jgi:hypothetical protein
MFLLAQLETLTQKIFSLPFNIGCIVTSIILLMIGSDTIKCDLFPNKKRTIVIAFLLFFMGSAMSLFPQEIQSLFDGIDRQSFSFNQRIFIFIFLLLLFFILIIFLANYEQPITQTFLFITTITFGVLLIIINTRYQELIKGNDILEYEFSSYKSCVRESLNDIPIDNQTQENQTQEKLSGKKPIFVPEVTITTKNAPSIDCADFSEITKIEKVKVLIKNTNSTQSNNNNATTIPPRTQLERYANMLTNRNWVELKTIYPDINQDKTIDWLEGSGNKSPIKSISLVEIIQEEKNSNGEILLKTKMRYCHIDDTGSEEIKEYTFIQKDSQWIIISITAPTPVKTIKC